MPAKVYPGPVVHETLNYVWETPREMVEELVSYLKTSLMSIA
jgi:hypothetical protein